MVVGATIDAVDDGPTNIPATGGTTPSVIGNDTINGGTAGSLLNDRQLYDNMNSTMKEMQGLLADIRKDPKKYLRVSVSIF